MHTAHRLVGLNIALLALGLLSAGCGSGTKPSSGVTTKAAVSTVPAGRTVQIVMRGLAFNPPSVHAKVGQTVIWSNQDNATHNVSYFSGPRFRSSPPKLRPGSRFQLTLHRPGTIHYYCSIHPWMTATIVVSP